MILNIKLVATILLGYLLCGYVEPFVTMATGLSHWIFPYECPEIALILLSTRA